MNWPVIAAIALAAAFAGFLIWGLCGWLKGKP